MAQTLTAEMHAILKEHVDANDRIAYYEQLKAWGYKYAELALGVVRGDTLSGRTANAFFLDQASDEGVTISKEELAQIGLELMRADFASRSVGSNKLSVDTIQDYHETVFEDHGVSSNGWTPDFALRSEPPQLNWSTVMFRKRRTTNGKQATEARRDCLEVTAG